MGKCACTTHLVRMGDPCAPQRDLSGGAARPRTGAAFFGLGGSGRCSRQSPQG